MSSTAGKDRTGRSMPSGEPVGNRALFVAATGGHLEQAIRISQLTVPRFDELEFVTFEDQQSLSLLKGQRVHFVSRVPPRGARQATALLPLALGIVRQGGYTDILSTGSGVAVPFLIAGSLARIRCHYIESAARSEGPSLTGRIVSQVHGVKLYTQYSAWADERWTYRGSIFDKFSRVNRADASNPATRIVVTLGTMRGYPFIRAVKAVLRLLGEIATPDADVLWQTGDAEVSELGINGLDMIPARELQTAMEASDLVIAHAGIGTCLQALEAGHAPVLLPRSKQAKEHIDDHQAQIAAELNDRGLAVSRDPDRLTAEDLWLARSLSVHSNTPQRTFLLSGFEEYSGNRSHRSTGYSGEA